MTTPTQEERVTQLEAAIVALATQRALEFVGDEPGHPFRGNQYTGGGGSGRDSEDVHQRIARLEREINAADRTGDQAARERAYAELHQAANELQGKVDQQDAERKQYGPEPRTPAEREAQQAKLDAAGAEYNPTMQRYDLPNGASITRDYYPGRGERWSGYPPGRNYWTQDNEEAVGRFPTVEQAIKHVT